MSKLIAMQGLQGSGKTTWAKQFCAENQNYYRVNADELRRMALGEVKWSRDKEDAVQIIQYYAVVELLKHDRCVVWDNMNLSSTAKNRCQAAADETGSQLLWHPMETSLDECIKRDADRPLDEIIGRAIIENTALYNDYIPWGEYPKPFVVFDLDGTLCNCEWRREICLTKKPPDWKHFFSSCGLDKPNWPILKWAQTLQNDYHIIISTGRPERYFNSTDAWLQQYGVKYTRIFMRRNSDNRHDYETKNDMCQHLPKDQILFVVDDRPQVVDMWRENGLKVYPVGGYREPKTPIGD